MLRSLVALTLDGESASSSSLPTHSSLPLCPTASCSTSHHTVLHSKQESYASHHHMHVTACLAGQEDVDVEVGEECRTLQALKEAIVKALPKLCVEGFDVSVGGRALDDDEGVVSLVDSVPLDVVPNTRLLSVLALRESGHEVRARGLLRAARDGDAVLCSLYLDAGVPIDCVDRRGSTPLHLSCRSGHLSVATLLLDRGSHAIAEKDHNGDTPLHLSCRQGHLSLVTLLLDRGSTAIDDKNDDGNTPLHRSCTHGSVEIATLLLDRGSTAIDQKGSAGSRPLVPALSPMGWRAVLRSGRVHKPWPRLRSSGSRHARHRSHIRQLRRARTIRHGSGRASGRANWYGGGSGRPRPTGRAHTRPRRVRGYR